MWKSNKQTCRKRYIQRDTRRHEERDLCAWNLRYKWILGPGELVAGIISIRIRFELILFLRLNTHCGYRKAVTRGSSAAADEQVLYVFHGLEIPRLERREGSRGG